MPPEIVELVPGTESKDMDQGISGYYSYEILDEYEYDGICSPLGAYNRFDSPKTNYMSLIQVLSGNSWTERENSEINPTIPQEIKDERKKMVHAVVR